MNRSSHRITLDLRPLTHLGDDNRQDPIRFYRWPFLGELYRRRVEMCLEELEGGDHVLEVGFGSGVTFPSLHRLYRRISGLDLLADANRVERFWRKRGIVAHLCNGDVTAMPYADGSMDAVLLISILEHLEPPQLARALARDSPGVEAGGAAGLWRSRRAVADEPRFSFSRLRHPKAPLFHREGRGCGRSAAVQAPANCPTEALVRSPGTGLRGRLFRSDHVKGQHRMAWLGEGTQRFDRLLLLCIAVIGVIYVISAWSPSSYAIVLRHLEAADDGLILGQPRAIRGDEFGWQTPLFQMAVNNGFRRFDATPPYFQDLRGLFGIPILDWGLLFKPNVWGFFVLPPAFAYSLYEFSLVAMLVVGFTFLFATAGGSRLHSLLMALVVFFTPYTQYWWNGFANFFLPFFPWLVLIAVWDARPILKWPLYYWLLTSCMLSYFYPPVLISLAFAGGVLVVALRPESLRARTLIPLSITSAMSAGTAAYYLRDTLTALAATIYPGQRLLPGGSVSFEIWVSQFLPTSQMHRHQSLIGINICEISTMASIYALAVLCFLDYRRRFQLKDSNRMAWTVGVLTAGVACHVVLDDAADTQLGGNPPPLASRPATPHCGGRRRAPPHPRVYRGQSVRSPRFICPRRSPVHARRDWMVHLQVSSLRDFSDRLVA